MEDGRNACSGVQEVWSPEWSAIINCCNIEIANPYVDIPQLVRGDGPYVVPNLGREFRKQSEIDSEVERMDHFCRTVPV